ncbi:hypothetical protein BESB_040980 [Besnoitia besnoiti]|uniref:TNase-like domain-containing protein n=1 Tax=Besnoitia besnoiti TaxID=94643 RepID=A0A2A9MPA8_BESBE|nr:hypothetical protein BESB_040980 [Besnoitia besnoiti]PFH37640.1 hypothetical protein BESB_040980 [Besnoitia besnoiti]
MACEVYVHRKDRCALCKRGWRKQRVSGAAWPSSSSIFLRTGFLVVPLCWLHILLFTCTPEGPVPVLLASVSAPLNFTDTVSPSGGDASDLLNQLQAFPELRLPEGSSDRASGAGCKGDGESASGRCVEDSLFSSAVPPSIQLAYEAELSCFFSPYASSLHAYSAYLPVLRAPRPSSLELLEALLGAARALTVLAPGGDEQSGGDAKRAKSSARGGHAQRKAGEFFVCLAISVADEDGRAFCCATCGVRAPRPAFWRLRAPPRRPVVDPRAAVCLCGRGALSARDRAVAAVRADSVARPLQAALALHSFHSSRGPRRAGNRQARPARGSACETEGRPPLPPGDRVDIDAGGQPFGVAAAARLAAEALGRVVLVKHLGLDRYGRTLARVFRVTREGAFVEAVRNATTEPKGPLQTAEEAAGGRDAHAAAERDTGAPRDTDPGADTRRLAGQAAAVKRRSRSAGAPRVAGLAPGAAKSEAQKLVARAGADERRVARALFVEQVLNSKNTEDIGDVLLREGLAVAYTRGGAKFDEREKELLALEHKAQQRAVGVWSVPESVREAPHEYRRRQRSRADAPPPRRH